MLGRIMNNELTDEQLGNFITGKIGPTGRGYHRDDCGCFIGTSLGREGVDRVGPEWRYMRHALGRRDSTPTGGWFERLCERFGTERIASALRNRALRILASRRGLHGPVPEKLVSSGPSLREQEARR